LQEDPVRLQLYYAPGACSRVTMNALEEIGIPYESVAINLFSGEQNSAGYREVNAKGKVPALAVDGQVMTENAAILHYLHRSFPGVGLLPDAHSLEHEQMLLADLLWCSSTLHPLVRQIRNPARMTNGETEALKARGIELFEDLMSKTNERLAERGPWWYGDFWSIVDVYLFWAYDVAGSAGFALARHAALNSHRVAVRSRPSFQRAQEREISAAERLGIVFPAGFNL
jgi:glutathione S-transferase